jgi:CheY-like chemotaxis protein
MSSALRNLQNTDEPGAYARLHPLVLITEDDEDVRLLIGTMVGTRGYDVIEAADGEEAVRLAELARPDLILMDGGLPRLDGLGATRRIRQLADGRRVPIIFLSGHAEPAFREVALEAGCDEYVVKPFDLRELGDLLARYLDRSAKASAT